MIYIVLLIFYKNVRKIFRNDFNKILPKFYDADKSLNKTILISIFLNKFYINYASTAYANDIFLKINHILIKISVNNIFETFCMLKFWIGTAILTEKLGSQIFKLTAKTILRLFMLHVIFF